jgi:fluoride ion exporter CrcB/FEX
LPALLILLTFLGGAVGSALRFLISGAVGDNANGLWIVNLVGALVLGFVQTSSFTKSPKAQSILGTGFAGGFTTVSGLFTFAQLTPQGSYGVLASQIFVGILAYWLGRILGGERTWSKS